MKHGLLSLLAATFLFCSCSTLTPDRIAVIAALAGNAAQIGVESWLVRHPEHRASFQAVANAIAAFLAAQGGPPATAKEATVAELLSSLPTPTLASREAELYVTGDNLVVWDARANKASTVEGPAVEPVLKAVREGMGRALAPMPPMPGRVRALVTAPGSSPGLVAGADTTPAVKKSLTTEPLKVTAPPQPIPDAVFALERRVDGTNWMRVRLYTNSAADRFQVLRVR